MKFNIRHSIFETNSSSTHALSVYKGDKNNFVIPENIKISLSKYQFGWDSDIYNDMHSKLAYLFLAIESSYDKDEYKLKHNQLKAMLHAIGVKNIEIGDSEDGDSWDYGYIDHGYETKEFVEELLKTPELLLGFIFNDKSIIETGNDNSDYIPEPTNDCDFGYEKGN